MERRKQYQEREREREKASLGKEGRGRERSKSSPKENSRNKIEANLQTPETQLKHTRCRFTKDGEHGFPVYFLGALVTQAIMAKAPHNPNDGLLVPSVGKGARLFWRRQRWQSGAMLLDTGALESASSCCSSCAHILHILLHAGLLHAEGDLGVLVAEQDVCNTRRWISGGV